LEIQLQQFGNPKTTQVKEKQITNRATKLKSRNAILGSKNKI